MNRRLCLECDNLGKSIFCSIETHTGVVIDELKSENQYNKGSILELDEPERHGLYCLDKGFIKVQRTLENGKDITFKVMAPGASFLASQSYNDHQIKFVFADHTKLCFIPENQFEILIQKSPQIGIELLKKTLSELGNAREKQASLNNDSATLRVAKTINYLQTEAPYKKWTRKDVSELSGTTLETTIRSIADLKKMKLIDDERASLSILNKKKFLEFIK